MKYTKRDGSVSVYPARYSETSNYIRGPHLDGKAPRRAKASQVALYLVDIGRSIRDARLSAGISVDELAAASGISRDAIFAIERQASTPSLKTFTAIAMALALSPSELLP